MYNVGSSYRGGVIMKRGVFLLSIFLALIGCSTVADEKLVHKDIESDINQLLEITDQADNEKRELTEEEEKLFDDFKYKYFVGKFTDSDKNDYEMNDLEKELVRKVESLPIFINGEETLSSDQSTYEMSKELINDLLNKEEISEVYKDKYPTYKKQPTFVHEQFLEDAENLLSFLYEMYESPSNNVSVQDLYDLNIFMSRYNHEYLEIDNEKYMHNEYSEDILSQVRVINRDIYEENNINLLEIEELEKRIERIKN